MRARGTTTPAAWGAQLQNPSDPESGGFTAKDGCHSNERDERAYQKQRLCRIHIPLPGERTCAHSSACNAPLRTHFPSRYKSTNDVYSSSGVALAGYNL